MPELPRQTCSECGGDVPVHFASCSMRPRVELGDVDLHRVGNLLVSTIASNGVTVSLTESDGLVALTLSKGEDEAITASLPTPVAAYLAGWLALAAGVEFGDA